MGQVGEACGPGHVWRDWFRFALGLKNRREGEVREGETGNRSRSWPGPLGTGREAGLGHAPPTWCFNLRNLRNLRKNFALKG